MSKLVQHPSCRIAFFIACLLAATRAAADEAEAKPLYSDGEAAFTAGRFDEAARLFQRAYQAYPHPLMLWNMATAYRRQYAISRDTAELRRARVVYQHYLELAPSGAQRSEARAAIAEVDAELTRQAALVAPAPAPRPRRRVWPWLVGGAGVLVASTVVLTVALVVPSNAPLRPSSDGALRVSFP